MIITAQRTNFKRSRAFLFVGFVVIRLPIIERYDAQVIVRLNKF